MKITAEDIEKVEKRFAAMSGDGLAAVKRDELAPWAQAIYDREIERRGPPPIVRKRPAQFRPVPPVEGKTNPLAIRKRLLRRSREVTRLCFPKATRSSSV